MHPDIIIMNSGTLTLSHPSDDAQYINSCHILAQDLLRIRHKSIKRDLGCEAMCIIIQTLFFYFDKLCDNNTN